jgi:hypothetical protein
MDPTEQQMLLSVCGVALSANADRQLPIHHLLGPFKERLIQRLRNETDPAPAILVLSVLVSLAQLKEGDIRMELPALCHLHHFFEIVNSEVDSCELGGTFWRMGCAIRRIIPEVEFIHPAFEYVPAECIWLRLEEIYWRGRVLEKRSHEDMLEGCHHIMFNGLRDSVNTELDCSGLCGVGRSG